MARSWICTRRWSRWAVQGEVESLETYLYIRVQSMAGRSEASRFILESIESNSSCLRSKHGYARELESQTSFRCVQKL